MSTIAVRDLRKSYVVPVRESGVRAALGALVRRKTREVEAVRDISFDIAAGEVVGFLGPNGAGKTTTLKMLAGLLHPTSGTAEVGGQVPWRRDHDYLRRMALIMGQRNQLQWDIPVLDSYRLNRAVYRIAESDFSTRLDELTDLLDLGDLLDKPVRNLSLGERMKCEVAGSLLHQPSTVFLDEPTIGLDVAMQRKIRSFIAEYNRRTGASVMLTSHYMGDVEALCERVIVIHHGRLLYDGGLAGLVRRFSATKTLTMEFDADTDLADQLAGAVAEVGAIEGVRVVEQSAHQLVLEVPKESAPAIAARVLSSLPVADLTIEEPPIEGVIERVFASEDTP
ncbi:ABC transporter ATP-binding protein [Aestuariimicrobium soli]|uniref:ABC transporter ATP-binding protein n=1 Tax=Aestuariimicrobium soli TaxID=2035834 RepID=UPI003EBF61EC